MGITIGLTVAFLVVVLRGPAFGLGGGVKGTPFLAGVFGGRGHLLILEVFGSG